MKFAKIKPFFQYTGKISYAIFLLQHVVMGQVIGLFSKYELTIPQETAILAATFLIIYLFSDIFVRLNQIMVHSWWFTKIEHFILNTPNLRKVHNQSGDCEKGK